MCYEDIIQPLNNVVGQFDPFGKQRTVVDFYWLHFNLSKISS